MTTQTRLQLEMFRAWLADRPSLADHFLDIHRDDTFEITDKEILAYCETTFGLGAEDDAQPVETHFFQFILHYTLDGTNNGMVRAEWRRAKSSSSADLTTSSDKQCTHWIRGMISLTATPKNVKHRRIFWPLEKVPA